MPSKLSGTGIVFMISGTVIAISGLRNATIVDTARAMISGKSVPTQGSQVAAARGALPQTGEAHGKFIPKIGETPSAAGSELGNRVAAAAVTYVGKVPYVFGGEDPSGWDCSGFTTWVMVKDCGLTTLPNSFHTTALEFLLWPGAVTIPRAQAAPGDLLCWGSHVGIALSTTDMVDAPNKTDGTLIEPIWKMPPPTVRRPKEYGAPS